MAKILVVEDDKALNASVCDILRSERHTVDHAFDGPSAMDLILTYHYDIFVLDVLLPGLTGFEICKQAREAGKTCGILMLTGQDAIAQKTQGLDAGADDYLTKPFDWRELGARIRSMLRRTSGHSVPRDLLTIGNVTLDLQSHKVLRDDCTVHLTPKEYALLEFMMRHKGQVFSAEALISRVWPAEEETSSEMIRSYIKNLRKKLDVEGQPSIFRTVHKVGYVIDDAN